MDLQQLAKEGAEAFTTLQRGEDDTIVVCTDDAPEWVRDIVRDAHGDMFPDDYRYRTIRDAFDHIAYDGDEDGRHEFADGVDVYTGRLLTWLASNLTRVGYVDDAVAEFGGYDAERGIVGAIMLGQYAERGEVFDYVLQGLQDRLAELEDADEDEDPDPDATLDTPTDNVV